MGFSPTTHTQYKNLQINQLQKLTSTKTSQHSAKEPFVENLDPLCGQLWESVAECGFNFSYFCFVAST